MKSWYESPIMILIQNELNDVIRTSLVWQQDGYGDEITWIV